MASSCNGNQKRTPETPTGNTIDSGDHSAQSFRILPDSEPPYPCETTSPLRADVQAMDSISVTSTKAYLIPAIKEA